VVGHSGSTRPYREDGSVRAPADRVFGLSAQLDDDGSVPVVFFSTGIDAVTEIGLADHQGRIDRVVAGLGHKGKTHYHLAMDAVIEHYLDCGAEDPAFVVFQTEGGPTGELAAERYMRKAARLPLFRQFIGFGDPGGKQFDFCAGWTSRPCRTSGSSPTWVLPRWFGSESRVRRGVVRPAGGGVPPVAGGPQGPGHRPVSPVAKVGSGPRLHRRACVPP
jgi:hypothetical protein